MKKLISIVRTIRAWQRAMKQLHDTDIQAWRQYP